MTRKSFGGSLAILLTAAVAQAQQPPLQPPDVPTPVPVQTQEPLNIPTTPAPTPPTSRSYGLEAESLPREIAEDIRRPTPPEPRRWGPTPVDEVGFLMEDLGLKKLFGDSGIRTFGWVEGGYTGASPGTGPLSVQPRQNRFGNEFLLDQVGLVLQKPLRQDQWDWGFNIRYFAGADAALGQPKGGIDSPPGNPRFSHDFRDLYLSAHLPIITEGGMNVKVGRMNTIIGWNGFLAPYRPFYSSDYQFFYSQDGAFTGFLTQLVVSDQLDVWNGMTFGANTFFEKRSNNSICYIGQINYWLTQEQRTRLTASTYVGPNAIFAAPGLSGDFVSMVELRIQQNWTERFTQVVQSNFGWDNNTPVGTGSWYGVYTIGILHVAPKFDLIGRGEWFRDVRGTRTGVGTDYSEVTLGCNWHPFKYIEIRPEIRGDFAGAPAFGINGAHTDRNQLTGAISFLTKF
jgi:hypothetical protein